MNIIVMNTANGFVSEYDIAGVQSVAGDLMAGNAGLLSFSSHGSEVVDAGFLLGYSEFDATLNKRPELAYISVRSAGQGVFVTATLQERYEYAFAHERKGLSRAKVGKGVRENYLAFGYRNEGGVDFEVDLIEVLVNSASSRRA